MVGAAKELGCYRFFRDPRLKTPAVGRSITRLSALPNVFINKGENERVEFKASIDDFTEEGMMRTIVAFLNSQGGTIFIGVNDRWDNFAFISEE